VLAISGTRPVRGRADLLKWYRLYESCSSLDDPDGPCPRRLDRVCDTRSSPVRGLLHGRRTFCGWWSEHSGDVDQVTQVAITSRGPVTGGFLLELPRWDYPHVAFCSLVVAPEARHEGLGRELLRLSARKADAAGRSTLIFYSRDGSAADSFLRAIGARQAGPTDIRQILDFHATEPRTPVVPAGSPGGLGKYNLIYWNEYLDERYLDGMARLLDAMADAPRPDTMAAEKWTPQRVQQYEAEMTGRGTGMMKVMAVHKAGEPAAFSEVVFDPALPNWGFQGATVVLPSHRGRDLGFLVKSALYGRIGEERPEATHISTTNNATNRRIITLNERLGFHPNAAFTPWEIQVNDIIGNPGATQRPAE